MHARDVPGGPTVETLGFQCRGAGLIPGQGARILNGMNCGQKIKQKKMSLKMHAIQFQPTFRIPR